ncbi:MAG: HlyD family secretion protein, partial [Gammaproteobacteria bacterium]|nr:HlyD family secretion protein [Gammaproteobacteria bacterium]
MTDETKKDSKEESAGVAGTPSMDPVRKWTLIILAVCGVLMIYYVVADRITPYTTQARVNALVVPVAAEVSGRVTEIAVQSNQF